MYIYNTALHAGSRKTKNVAGHSVSPRSRRSWPHRWISLYKEVPFLRGFPLTRDSPLPFMRDFPLQGFPLTRNFLYKGVPVIRLFPV